jgi:hypothetical protein
VDEGRDADVRLVRFLLGDLPEEERRAIEHECFRVDGAAFAEILALEDELRFAYLQNRLTADERRAFDERHLRTLSDRARLAFARALTRVADARALTSDLPKRTGG